MTKRLNGGPLLGLTVELLWKTICIPRKGTDGDERKETERKKLLFYVEIYVEQ